MELTRENVLWARNLCMREAKSIRENIAEAPTVAFRSLCGK